MYLAADKTLYVHLMSDLTSPIATYELNDVCKACIIADNRLYLGGNKFLHVYQVNNYSLTSEPLEEVTKLEPKWSILKIIRVGNELVLGEWCDYL